MDAAAAVQDCLDRYCAAAAAADVEAMMSLYAPEARVFDTWSVWSHDSAAAWREAIAEWFGGLGTDRVAVTFDEIRIIDRGDTAVAQAFVTYRGLNAAGEEQRSMQNRLSWVLAERPDGWCVVHEHTSAPIDGNSGRAMLHRTADATNVAASE